MTPSADLLLHNGIVWTGVRGADGAVVRSDAVAVKDGLVLALGEQGRSAAGPGTVVVDLEGGTLLPGFGDGHAHPVFGGTETLFAPVRHHDSVDSIVAAVGAWANDNPDAEWVRGEGYDITLASNGEFDAEWLDAVVPDRPVVLRGADYHTAWVNSLALQRAGISAQTPDPHDGIIGRRPDGTPSGMLREWGAWRLVYDLLPPLTPQQRGAAVRAACATFASSGVTWVQDAWVESDTLETWLSGMESGLLTMRVNLGLLAEPDGRWKQNLATMVAQRERVKTAAAAVGGNLLTANTVKFFADGIIEGGTAALVEPYCDCPSTGLPNWEPDELIEAVVAVVGAGFQPHIHAIGDAGVRNALDAFEAAISVHGSANTPTIAHVQLIAPSDVARFAELGVVANFEPLWAQLDPTQTELTIPRIGAERGSRQYQLATLLAEGTRISFGSDWPVTSPVPLKGIAVAVTRQTDTGEPALGWTAHERLSLDQALAAYTSGVAVQAREAGQWGVIAPGARADLALAAVDLHAVEALELHEVPIVGTWLAGHRVWG